MAPRIASILAVVVCVVGVTVTVHHRLSEAESARHNLLVKLEQCTLRLAQLERQSDDAVAGNAGAPAAAPTSSEVPSLEETPESRRPTTLRRRSDSGDYEVITRSRPADRRPSVSMPNVTLVTHVTADRAARLAQLCRTWRGPMSVSVFEKPGEAPGWAVEQVAAADECLRRHADLHTVRSARAEGSGADMFAHYPFNVQRNAALDGAVGEWVLLLDVDFVMTPGEAGRERVFTSRLHELRARHAEVLGDDEEERARAVLVLPAVETVTKEVAAPTSVGGLREALSRHEVCAFYGHYCKACHLPTQVERWVGLPAGAAPYRIEYEEGYEPYVVVSRKHLPRYDEKFIGRGWDKMSFFFELGAQERRFFALPPPFPFLVHSGRGDLPTNYTAEYMDRQRENSMLMYNFKAEVLAKYNPQSALARAARESDAIDVQHRKQLIDWATVSSSRGEAKACVSRWRGAALDNTTIPKLEAALSYACSHIDCSPLLPGGIRQYPTSIAAHADWAFDRYMGYAMERGESPEQACNFDGAAKIVTCAKQCMGCIVKPTAPVTKIHAAVEWVCGPDALENCKAVLTSVGGNSTRGLEAKAAVLFTFNYLVNRCVHHDSNVACFYGGAGMRVPCARVPD